MKLLSKKDETIKREIYQVEENGKQYTLIWYIEPERHKIIDVELRDKDGYSLDDPALLEEINLFLDDIETILESPNKSMDSAPLDRPIWAFTGDYWGWFYWSENSKKWLEQGHQKFTPNKLVCWKVSNQ